MGSFAQLGLEHLLPFLDIGQSVAQDCSEPQTLPSASRLAKKGSAIPYPER
jgi:hypothetical protein